MVVTSSKVTLYEVDYALWLDQTLEQVKNRQLEALDWENLAQEIEDLGIELRHKVDSYLKQRLSCCSCDKPYLLFTKGMLGRAFKDSFV